MKTKKNGQKLRKRTQANVTAAKSVGTLTNKGALDG